MYSADEPTRVVPTASLFVLSQLLASMASTIEGLALPTMLLGIGYGALFAVSPVVCLERFGLASFATNNGLLMLAPSISGTLVVQSSCSALPRHSPRARLGPSASN